MTCFETHITDSTFEFFIKNQNTLLDYIEINLLVKKVSGINNFFTSQKEATELLVELKEHSSIVSEPNRREYGDFQTNKSGISRLTPLKLAS